MFNFVLSKIIGSQNERELRRLKPKADLINSLEPKISALSDSELCAKTAEFRQRLARGETLEDILPEAFAVVREAGKRTIRMRHFDVQHIGGIVLHEGKIAEMATGEGKTLVATLAVYLNGLSGEGVHLVTVNDYLARRDREWMGPIYEFLGLSCGAIQHDMGFEERKRAYACDVTYGTNNEFGFDYLRDNMVMRGEERVQRQLNFAIVDEVDSILIDEARTPLIISGPAEESTDKYYKIDKTIPRLIKGSRDESTKQESGDYIVDEKAQTAYLTEEGEIKAARLLGLDNLHDIDSMEHKHHINQALRAHNLFKRDADYVIKDDKVIIVDEFTGRMMPGRRWSDGLHQAIEAKEGVRIERENQTLATITFQNYFRMYKKLAGMTGTAATEAGEFREIYKLETIVIPPNKTLIRTNHPDVIYKTGKEKFKAVCDEIEELHRQGRPVLVGTISIEKSERISEMLKEKGIPHNVLNAKYHEMEAHIVAQAGRLGNVTIATNMAGRGTDILLGGNPEFMTDDLLRQKEVGPYDSNYKKEREELLAKFREKVEKEHSQVVALGGLHIIGTERHEARRIDNQLRGRAGRQGDPGSSRFYLSLEDDLMRIFGSDRIAGIMDRLGMEEGQDIQHPLVTKAIEVAQRRVESYHFETRKHVLEYDNVMNRQREVIYEERRLVLEGENLKEHIYEMINDVLEKIIDIYLPAELDPGEWDWNGLAEQIRLRFNFPLAVDSLQDKEDKEKLRGDIYNRIIEAYGAKEKMLGCEVMRSLEKIVVLRVIDSKWKDHLYAMDLLKEGIGLRAYGQRDPLVEYQHEGYQMFSDMIESVKEEATEFVFSLQPVGEAKLSTVFSDIPQEFVHPQLGRFGEPSQARVSPLPPPEESPLPYQRETPKVGRNEPCPCGAIDPNTGKPIKYKKCHGR